MRTRRAWAGVSDAFLRMVGLPVRLKNGVPPHSPLDINQGLPGVLPAQVDSLGTLRDVKVVIDDHDAKGRPRHREIPINLYRLPE